MTSELLTNAEKLNRLLFLTEIEPRYLAGDPENYFLKDVDQNFEVVKNIIKNVKNIPTLIKLLLSANNNQLLPRRITLFYVLAFALSQKDIHKDDVIRTTLAELTLRICKTDEEFFKFISIFTKLNKTNSKNKITTALGRSFKMLIDRKSPLLYAQAVGKAKGYHGWKYKDLIKLSHYKSFVVEKTLITSYVLFGLEKLQEQDSKETEKICVLIEKWERLRKTDDEVEASKLVRELHANFSQVNPKFVKSQEVWSSIIPELPVREILRLLPKFYKFGLLKANSKVHGKVVEALTSLERVKDCRLHPLEVFIYMKDFEKGGKPIDPKLEIYLKSKNEAAGDAKEKIEKVRSEPKCPIITTSLGKCLNLAYPKDAHSMGMGKRIVLALDVTQHSEAVCFKNKNITCLEAQLALTLFYFKTEKNINVTFYHDKGVKGFNLDKNVPFAQSLQKLKDNKSEYMVLPSVFDWAIGKKKEVDVFICFMQTIQSLYTAPKEVKTPSWNSAKDGFLKYQKKMSSPSTKLVVICLGSHNLAGFDDIKALTICGFCPEIPKIIQAFVEGSFK